MNEPDMTPLMETTLEQLMEELQRRHDAFVFAWTKTPDDETSTYGTWRRGNDATCIGLCRRMERAIHIYVDEHCEDME